MAEPLKKGDLAEIIEGASGKTGPNIGKIVTVGQAMGEHSRFGRIVRVTGDKLTRLGDMGFVVSDWADVAVAWLRKIEPNQNQGDQVVDSKEAING